MFDSRLSQGPGSSTCCARLGDETFWKASKHYAEKHRLQSVETSDFRRALEEVSGLDLERSYDWTERGGALTLEVKSSYDADHK